MLKLIFFWGANALEASATVSQCLFSNSQGINLEPAGEFVILLTLQMLGSWVVATCLKKDRHTVNTVSEAIVLALTAINWAVNRFS